MTRLKQALVIVLGIGLAAAMVALGFWQLAVYRGPGSRGRGTPGVRPTGSA